MGAELRAHAISHLEEISASGIDAMSNSGTVGILLPTTAYNLRLKPPPARDIIQQGVPVALGSDFNPNAHCLSMVGGLHLLFYISKKSWRGCIFISVCLCVTLCLCQRTKIQPNGCTDLDVVFTK